MQSYAFWYVLKHIIFPLGEVLATCSHRSEVFDAYVGQTLFIVCVFQYSLFFIFMEFSCNLLDES